MKKIFIFGLLLSTVLSAATLELTAGDTYFLTSKKNLVRFVNTDPEVVSVTQSGNKLSVKARNIGTAKVFYWTDEQEILVVQVKGRKTAAVATRTQKQNGKLETYFKFDPVNSTPVNQRLWITSLDYAFLTGSGVNVDLFTSYRQNAIANGGDTGQIERATLTFSKSGNHLVVGDTLLKYSELALPYLEMQGVQGNYRWGNFLLNGFAGKRPGNLWGTAVGENYISAKDQDVDVSGAKVTWLINDSVDVGVTALQRSAPSENILGSYSVQAGELNYRKDDYKFIFELANSDQKGHQAGASHTELNYDTEKLGWQIAYRDIAPDYHSLADYFNYAGMQGVSFYGRANPFRSISFSGSYENYLQRFDRETITNPDHAVERFRLRLGLDKIIFFRPSVTYYANYRDEFRTSGLNVNLYEIEILKRSLWAYYDFATWKYAAPSAEYATDRSLAGLTYRWNLLTLKTERVNEVARFVFGGERYGTSGWNVITSLGDFNFKTGVKVSLSYWHQNRKNTLETVDKNRNSIRLALGQTIGDLYWYLNGVAARENSLFYEYQGAYARDGYFYHDELTQSEISGGLVYRF